MTNPFKGIALLTPGGDLIYCIDDRKQGCWHLDLCVGLQEILGLSEPPHFLVPGYTATVDRWLDTHSQQLKTIAEVYPAVKRYQSLLNAVFGTGESIWQTVPWQEEFCSPLVIENYRHQFPQLWENHDLIVRLTLNQELVNSAVELFQSQLSEISSPAKAPTPQGYVLRLFVSSHSPTTEQTLEKIHQLLEQGLRHPYTLKIIDISTHPEQAESHQVSATPTLVRVWPQPVRRIVGELEDIRRGLQILTS